MATITPAATFPGAAAANTGNPNPYSGTFIPTLWSGKLIEKFYDATVLGAISNTDYEGEIAKFGDKVIIRQKPTIAINNYTSGLALTSERPNEVTKSLSIDKGKYWSTELDDVMEVQADIDMLSMWADDASEQMKIAIDTDVLGGMLGTGAATNRGATAGRKSGNINLGVTAAPLAITKTNVTDVIIHAGQCLDENNIPENGRWMVIPAWLAARIKLSDLKDASLSGDSTSILRNGRLGQIDRFTLYMSNLLPQDVAGGLAADEFGIYFGSSLATTFASQVTKVETLRAEQTFGTIMRGLQVYGYDVIKPEALGQIIASPA